MWKPSVFEKPLLCEAEDGVKCVLRNSNTRKCDVENQEAAD